MEHATCSTPASELNGAGRRHGGASKSGARNAAARTNQRAEYGPVKGVAAAKGFPYTTVRDACMRGDLPFVRVGRAIYVKWADVDRWLESHTERVA